MNYPVWRRHDKKQTATFPVRDTKCILTTCNYRICSFLTYHCGWKFSLIGFISMLLHYAITVVMISVEKGTAKDDVYSGYSVH